jgi:ribosomal protein S12 methylthiotransferase accessory factor
MHEGLIMAKLLFKPHLQVIVIPGEGVLLLSEEKVWALHGKLYELLVPLIDGSRDADALADALAKEVDGARVYYALALLEKNGHIAENVPDVPKQTAAFWHSMDIEPYAAIKALGSKRVRVRAVGEADAAPLEMALKDLGMVLAQGETIDFEVVVTDDYLRLELQALNAASLLAGRPWLLLKPVGHEPWLGPLYVPGRTACHCCLTRQLLRNRPVYKFVAERNKLPEPPPAARAAVPATINAVCQLAAVEVVKFIAGAGGSLEGRVLSLDVRTWSVLSHVLSRQSACRGCGVGGMAKAIPVELVNRKVTFIQDCGHRTQRPEETLEKYQHLVSPITGVVTMLAPVHNANGLVHVYLAGHNHAFSMRSLDSLKASLRDGSGGKGISDVQAKASALCEAIERYSGERTGAESVVTACFREMRERFGPDAIHPNEVMLYSNRQLAEHRLWNKKRSKFNRIAEPLDESVPIDWTPVWSLTHARHKYLPTQLLYYGSKASATCNAGYSVGCSNGNASGNTLEEAVLQGFCELVERDAVALWWYNRLRKPLVAVESFDEPYFLDLIGYYRTLSREVWALDITSDLGIPAFAVASRLCTGPEECILFGFGCHLDARIALQRAFAEVNQMLALVENIEDEETISWFKTATLANQPYMAPNETIAPRCREDYPCLCSGELLEDIGLCRRIVEKRRMEVLVLDQTRPEVKMPVVKVIVPGLRHFWARFAPGRLYDVPVQMGWQERPLAEGELNPIPVFL